MTRRSTKTALENEIERGRVEGRWESVQKLVEQISNRTTNESNVDAFKTLLLCESDLEICIRDNQLLGSANHDLAKRSLQLTVNKLVKISQETKKKDEKSQEAILLLCKAYFIMGNFQTCIKFMSEASNEDLTVDIHSRRRSKLVAEGFAFKAMALEELQVGGNIDVNREDQDILSCYECAGDIAIWLMSLHRAPIIQHTPREMSMPLEVAIQRAPILLIKSGKLSSGVNRFRNMLKALESRATHDLRKVLARELAEVLLRGICEEMYEKPVYQNTNIPGSMATLSKGSAKSEQQRTKVNAHNITRASFSLKPFVYSGDSLFVPRDEMEEILLLLLLEDAMVLRDAVLSQAPTKSESRRRTVEEANIVYDLLVIALTRRGQYGMLVECLDKGMKLAFEEFHLWFQFGLSLISAGKYQRGLLVLRQCASLNPDDALVHLYAAKLCFNHLHQLEEGVEFAKKVVAMGDGKQWTAKGYQVLGIGYSLLAGEALLSAERLKFQKLAIDALEKALGHEPDDPELLFNMALTQAHTRQISQAIKNLKRALKLDGDNMNSLHLMVLLLSAQNKYGEALEVCEAALLEFPEDINLMLTKVKLEEVCLGGDQALITCKQLLETWKLIFESEMLSCSTELKRAGSGLLDKVVADSRSLKQFPLTEIGSEKDDDTGSIAASVRLERTLSDEAASTTTGKLSIPAVLALQAKIWLAIADLFIGMKKDTEASACVQEANLIFPLSADVLYQRGRIYEMRGSPSQAKACYNNAIAINPSHIPSMQRMGEVYEKLNNLVMAEKILREAINIDPTACVAWHYLGVVLGRQGEHEAASECLFTAVDLKATAPICSFSVIPRLL